MKSYKIIKALKIVAFVVIAGLLFGGVVMFLWNWLIPDIFAGPQINFWQAIGILVLARILTGGFRGPWNRHKRPHHWRKRWKQKWEQMSPEERERLKEKYAHRCGRRSKENEENTGKS